MIKLTFKNKYFMKSKKFLFISACVLLAIGFSACKKDGAKTGSDEVTTTLELSGDQAISDNTNADAEYILNEAAVNNNFAGNSPVGITSTMNVLGCSAVTVTPLQGFPKTIVIDFGSGTGCTPADGIVRSGKINVTLSDSLRKSGSVATMTFDNYYVGGFKKEGTITWTNTSQAGIKSWERVCTGGKITAPGGRYWLHSGTQDVVQTEGASTPFNLLDDVFSTTGSATVTNSAGVSRTAEITSALEKKVICANIDEGSIKITGPNHYAVIDYGDGTCDREASISIDGSNPITFLLR
jgi:hypothetical protein